MKLKYIFLLLWVLCISCAFASSMIHSNKNKPTQKTLIIPKIKVNSNADANPTVSQFPINAHTQIICAKTIKKTAADNLEQVLQGLVGLQVNDLIGNGTQISIGMRGFGSNAAENSLILINGVPLANPDLAVPNLSSIPVKAISKIEIINGSAGVLFGDQAVGGVINIITKTPHKNAIDGSISRGSFNTNIVRQGISFLGPDNLYASIHVKKYRSNNFREHNLDTLQQAFGSFGQQKNAKSSWNVYYDINHQFLKFAGALTAEQVQQNRRQAENNDNFANKNRQYIQLTQHHSIGKKWQEHFEAAHRNLDGNGFLFNPFGLSQQENWLKLQFKGLADSVFITTGFNLGADEYHLRNGSYLTGDNQTQTAVFVLGEIPFRHIFHLFVGARSAWQWENLATTVQVSQQQSAFVTTLGVNVSWHPWLTLFLRRAGNYRFPKADENATTLDGIGGLKVQRGVSYELGARFHKMRWHGTVSIFDLSLRNEIAFDPTSTPLHPFGVNRNLPPTQRLGFLFNGDFKVNHQLTIGGQYTHIAATFRQGLFSGNQIPFVPQNTFSVFSNWHVSPYINFFTQVIYTGSRFYSGDDTNQFPKEPAFTVVNLAVGIHRKYFFATFRINNVFNAIYNAFASVNTVSLTPFRRQAFFYPAPGRNFLITLGFKLA